MRSEERVSKVVMAPHIAGALAALRPCEVAMKVPARAADLSAPTRWLSELLLASVTTLARAGEIETACRLAGQAYVTLADTDAAGARRFDVLLHRLTPRLTRHGSSQRRVPSQLRASGNP